jgi:hypothetical protein
MYKIKKNNKFKIKKVHEASTITTKKTSNNKINFKATLFRTFSDFENFYNSLENCFNSEYNNNNNNNNNTENYFLKQTNFFNSNNKNNFKNFIMPLPTAEILKIEFFFFLIIIII